MTRDLRRSELPTRESLDTTGHEELREELRRQLPPSGGDARAPDQQEATDATGAVTVLVDARGRVTDVDIGRNWRDRLDGQQLLDAVSEAYTGARQQAIAAAALATIAQEDAGVDAPRAREEVPEQPAAPPPPRGRARTRPADLRERLSRTWERFARIREESDRAAAARSGHVDRTGPNGYLTARLQGDSVVGVAGDVRRLWYAETRHLREDALAVLSAGNASGG